MTQEQVAKLNGFMNRIGSGLISATPEWWTDATLRVEVKTATDGGVSISHSITSEQHKDVVVGSDEIFTATRELQLMACDSGEPWSAFIMRVQLEDEQWKFKVNFEYAD